MGQGAGAALAVNRGVGAREAPVAEMLAKLTRSGAVVAGRAGN